MTLWDTLLVRSLPLKGAVRGALAGRNRSRANAALGRFTRRDCNRLTTAVLIHYSRLAAVVAPQPNLGSRLTVRFGGVLLAALLEAMLEEGLERDYAIELIGDSAWRIYRRWGQVANLLVGPFSRDPVRRIRLAVGMFLHFPFGELPAPGHPRSRRASFQHHHLSDFGLPRPARRCRPDGQGWMQPGLRTG